MAVTTPSLNVNRHVVLVKNVSPVMIPKRMTKPSQRNSALNRPSVTLSGARGGGVGRRRDGGFAHGCGHRRFPKWIVCIMGSGGGRPATCAWSMFSAVRSMPRCSSVATTPRTITSTRSHRRASSSLSVDTKQHRHRLGGVLLDDGVHLFASTDVDARGRVVEHEHTRGETQCAGDEHLLLVAAGQAGDRDVGTAGDDAQLVDPVADLGSLGLDVDPPGAGVPPQIAHREVGAQVHVAERAVPGPFARDPRHPGRQRGLRLRRRHLRPGDGDGSATTPNVR